ncbi:uncharacterized protein PGRI_030900 [Penicillium griseofulvum]|uniref:Terpenoid synthase n=1 Tax=Penicillium patulum TaxID=5078 RepID=A0A135LJY0_PENPA|nr:uncharacterized protein PGRI_030900 [Penicillium griseofulvum]KXG49220.1 hypothetical protein PGRI_030900 [Penicillium griseofulvum]
MTSFHNFTQCGNSKLAKDISPENHSCKIESEIPIQDETIDSDIWISLFQKLQDICTDSDPYTAAESLRREINNMPTTGVKRSKDYSLHIQKGDTSVEETCLYAMRDAIQWWRHWHRSLEKHHWKHLYVAFSTIPQDITIPPQHLVNGEFCFLGNSFADVLDGLHKEGVSSDQIAFMEMCLLRQYLVQYISKQEPQINLKFHAGPAFASNWRNINGNVFGSTMAILAARATDLGIVNIAVKMTTIADYSSMNLMGKLSILTDKVVSEGSLAHNLYELYFRYMELLDLQPSAPLISRSVSSGLHFIPSMDGARERLRNVRTPMLVSLRHTVGRYIQR